ncbi:hypothetical protein [Frondihabitans sp. 762G35]|uniref:hypothetical protein n=1 Tax=Frondihabitans sp. 762G35 TaxID=1446794 RepID=UPI0013DB0B67|nr:hypothetical protein [Frondihabitans sp. 762G35]
MQKVRLVHDATPVVRLRFFGVDVAVSCTRRDVDDLDFLYGSFLTDDASFDPAIHVTLKCSEWPSRGFFTSLLAKDRLLKSIEVEPLHVDARLGRSSFREWSTIPSPFPPLFHSRLWSSIATTPGALVQTGSGQRIFIVGENYVGKTALALALCRRGARLVTDNITSIDTQTGRVLTYETPLGFRRQSLLDHLPVFDRHPHRTTVSPDTGLVGLLSPSSVLGFANAPGGRIARLVVLRSGESETMRQEPAPQLPWFTGVEGFDQRDYLPDEALVVTVKKGTPPDDIAALIENRFVE